MGKRKKKWKSNIWKYQKNRSLVGKWENSFDFLMFCMNWKWILCIIKKRKDIQIFFLLTNNEQVLQIILSEIYPIEHTRNLIECNQIFWREIGKISVDKLNEFWYFLLTLCSPYLLVFFLLHSFSLNCETWKKNFRCRDPVVRDSARSKFKIRRKNKNW